MGTASGPSGSEASHDPSRTSLTYLPTLTYSTTPHSSLVSTPTGLSESLTSGSASVSAPLPSTGSLQPPSGVQNNATSSISQSQNSTVSSSESSTKSALRYMSGSLSSSISYTSTSDNEIETSFSTTTSDATWSVLSSGSSSTVGWSSSGDATSGGAGATASAESGDASGETWGDDSGSGPGNLSPQEKQIVGGVVGSVAGAAFLLLLVMMAIKWKKRRHDVQELIGGDGRRAISASPTGRPGDGGS